MSGFRRFDIIEPSSSSSSSSLYFGETSIFKPTRSLIFPSFTEELDLDFAFNLLSPNPFDLSPKCFFPSPPPPPTTTPFDILDTVTDLIQVQTTPFTCSYKRLQNRNVTDFYLRNLSDRVSALEIGLDRVIDAKIREQDRKYSWTAEIKSAEKNGVDRKYKWIAEIKGAKKETEAAGVEKNYKWIAEIKGKGKDSPISRTYTFKASTTPAAKESKDCAKKKDKKEEKKTCATRVVSIEEPDNSQGALYLKQVCILTVCGLNSC